MGFIVFVKSLRCSDRGTHHSMLWGVTFPSHELGTLFSAFGEVTSATVIKKKRRSMGYGFVTYSSLDDAVIATSVMNGYIVGNRPLRVTFSHSAEKTRQIEQPINATFCRIDRYAFFRADADTDYYRSRRPITDVLNRYVIKKASDKDSL
uniref:RRM domain-containing protein n=1 Tax=Cyprinus carpio carpio TaxID=630221 RepID=A0A9J8C369_CYPCA